jgi:hypothetical protein
MRKFWPIKYKTKSPTTSTEQMLASASSGVSFASGFEIGAGSSGNDSRLRFFDIQLLLLLLLIEKNFTYSIAPGVTRRTAKCTHGCDKKCVASLAQSKNSAPIVIPGK